MNVKQISELNVFIVNLPYELFILFFESMLWFKYKTFMFLST